MSWDYNAAQALIAKAAEDASASKQVETQRSAVSIDDDHPDFHHTDPDNTVRIDN